MRKTKSSSVFLFAFLLLPFTNAFAAETQQPAQSVPRYPVSNSDRPFTLPSAMAEADLLVHHSALHHFGVSIGGGYGITDNLQINASYDGVMLRDFETVVAEKSFHLGFGYFLFETPFMASMADVDFPLYVEANWAQNIKLALPTAIPIWRAARLGMMILQSGVIDFQFNPYFAADINIPGKISWQATEGLSLALGTNFATFNINRPDGKGGNLGHDYIWTKTPLYLNALYGFNDMFDLLVRVGFHDLQKNLGEEFYAWIGIGFRFGRMSS